MMNKNNFIHKAKKIPNLMYIELNAICKNFRNYRRQKKGSKKCVSVSDK